MLKKTISSVAVAAMLIGSVGFVSSAEAVSFPPAPAPKGTHLGFVKVDPYGFAPLTAIIDLNSKRIKNVTVTVKGKPNGGIDISYPVGAEALLTHDGVPVVGMYEDYRNNVIVSYTDITTGKKYKDIYSILTSSINVKQIDNRNVTSKNKIEVKKVNPKFKDKLFMTNSIDFLTEGTTLVWAQRKSPKGKMDMTAATPSTGSLPFEGWGSLYITDTKGEYRWWLDMDMLQKDGLDVEKRGNLMGVRATANGTFTFVMGQMWGEFDLTGKLLYKHRLPRGYIDASHESVEMPNGDVLVRAAKANYTNIHGDIVHTVRDHILQLDKTGRLVRVWDLNLSLDPHRDTLLKGLDMGAVCLNVDVDQAGQTIADFKVDAPYGDIAGIGTGRNWAHVNSISYDPRDDSIILSLRHQGTVKLTGDNKVKWILAPRAGWNKELSKKLLTPVDKNGKEIKCDDMGVCEDTDFDFSYTQHTSWLSPNNTLTVLDNGDGRHNTQPALPTDKYTRYVEYDIDEKNGTVQQIWEYGKERGYDWYSPITSNVELITDDGKPYMYGFGGSAGMFTGDLTKGIHNIIDYDTKDVMVEIVTRTNRPFGSHYRGLLMQPNKWFSK